MVILPLCFCSVILVRLCISRYSAHGAVWKLWEFVSNLVWKINLLNAHRVEHTYVHTRVHINSHSNRQTDRQTDRQLHLTLLHRKTQAIEHPSTIITIFYVLCTFVRIYDYVDEKLFRKWRTFNLFVSNYWFSVSQFVTVKNYKIYFKSITGIEKTFGVISLELIWWIIIYSYIGKLLP